MCYAYKDNYVEELLANHLVNVARCCQNRWEFEALSNKISRLLGIPKDHVGQTIVLAALLHDIGKAASEFQRKCYEYGCREFHKHYLISAFLIHLAFRASGISISTDDVVKFFGDAVSDMDRNTVLGLLVVLPVAFHHYHQVGGTTSYRVGQVFMESYFADNLSIWESCRESLAKLANAVRLELWSTVVQTLQDILSGIEQYKQSDLYKDSKMFIGNFHKAVEENLKLTSITLSRIVVESITGLINLCDGQVAYEARTKRAATR